MVARRMEADALCPELPKALKRCVDPAKFAIDAVSEVFPVDRQAVRSPTNLAWARQRRGQPAGPAEAGYLPEKPTGVEEEAKSGLD
uniref:FRIGIDA-like protein n=1 Tax=Leersia perrieri TaxID=77586 RepID=A0A0D9VYS6_9ORYZ